MPGTAKLTSRANTPMPNGSPQLGGRYVHIFKLKISKLIVYQGLGL